VTGRQYGFGIIGCGSVVRAWLPAFQDSANCGIAAVFDSDDAAAERLARECGSVVCRSVDELLESDLVRIVLVATPPRFHADLTVRAVQAGKHVLCEKPMALHLGDCRRMIAAAEAARVKLAVGHTLRFLGAFFTARQVIAAGQIGRPILGGLDRVRRALSRSNSPPGGPWRNRVEESGGILLEEFIHELDFARSIWGEVESVSCRFSDATTASEPSQRLLVGAAQFAGGALVSLRAGQAAAPPRANWISGTEGGLEFSRVRGPLTRFRADVEPCETIPGDGGSAYSRELRDLIDAIEHDKQPENSGLSGLRNVAFALGLCRAHEESRTVAFRDGLPEGVRDDYQNRFW
jgi:myo-inositol 2-dehydrogenase/D-chiro-inositol 1-dehydrogenase